MRRERESNKQGWIRWPIPGTDCRSCLLIGPRCGIGSEPQTLPFPPSLPPTVRIEGVGLGEGMNPTKTTVFLYFYFTIDPPLVPLPSLQTTRRKEKQEEEGSSDPSPR